MMEALLADLTPCTVNGRKSYCMSARVWSQPFLRRGAPTFLWSLVLVGYGTNTGIAFDAGAW